MASPKKQVKKEKKPTKKEMVDMICGRIEQGLSLRKATAGNKPISMGAFLGWCNEDTAIAEQYARAREVRADIIFDEILEIADDTSRDAEDFVGGNHVKRADTRINARKWVLGKMNPKKFGDKVDLTTGGEKLSPVQIFIPDNNR